MGNGRTGESEAMFSEREGFLDWRSIPVTKSFAFQVGVNWVRALRAPQSWPRAPVRARDLAMSGARRGAATPGRTRAAPNPFLAFTRVAPEPAATASFPLTMAQGQCVKGVWYYLVDPFAELQNLTLTEPEQRLECDYNAHLCRVVVAASAQTAKSPILDLIVEHVKSALSEYERDPSTGSVSLLQIAEHLKFSGTLAQLVRAESAPRPMPPELAEALRTSGSGKWTTVDVPDKEVRYAINPVR